jgi:hypothetical protein
MTFELSTMTKLLALVGVLLTAGMVGTFLLLENHRSASPPVVVTHTPTPSHTRVPTHPRIHISKPATPTVTLSAGLPAPVRSALTHSRLVVAVVYAPGDAVDSEVYAQARQGARAAGAPLVGLNIRTDSVAAATATWMQNVIEPAVLVVVRPGRIAVELNGYTDQASVAQAIVDARG